MILLIWLSVCTFFLVYLYANHDYNPASKEDIRSNRNHIWDLEKDINRREYLFNEKLKVLQKQIDRLSDNVFTNKADKSNMREKK